MKEVRLKRLNTVLCNSITWHSEKAELWKQKENQLLPRAGGLSGESRIWGEWWTCSELDYSDSCTSLCIYQKSLHCTLTRKMAWDTKQPAASSFQKLSVSWKAEELCQNKRNEKIRQQLQFMILDWILIVGGRGWWHAIWLLMKNWRSYIWTID